MLRISETVMFAVIRMQLEYLNCIFCKDIGLVLKISKVYYYEFTFKK